MLVAMLTLPRDTNICFSCYETLLFAIFNKCKIVGEMYHGDGKIYKGDGENRRLNALAFNRIV